MPNSILVTGGAGYIGSRVTKALLSQGLRVVVLDDLSTGDRDVVPQGAEFIQGDIGDAAFVSKIFADYNIKTVMHLAAFVKVEESVENPEKYIENNFRKSELLFKAASKAGVEHLIFSSSAAVYGSPIQGVVDETAELKPISPYGDSKLFAEQALEKIAKEGNMHATILRYFNVAGGGYSLKEKPTHLIRNVILAAVGNVPSIKIFGTDYPTPDGTTIRDYIHVDDLANIHLALLTYISNEQVNIFNCGYGHGRSVLEVIEAAKRLSKNDFEVVHAPRRAGDPATVVANSGKLMQALAWKPQFDDLDAIIQSELEWVRLSI